MSQAVKNFEREENIEQTVRSDEHAAIKDYEDNFMPAVHRIGRITMAVSFCITFLPIIYFGFILGYMEPMSTYFNVLVAIFSIGIGMWLTEPLTYWPVLGSAGTYMSYLSGNVGAMRFPVALSVQAAMKADINTPRGQVATIIGIGASIFTNLIILIVIVLGGSWLISVLPAAVMAAFSFVIPSMYGSMFLLRFRSHKNGVVAGFFDSLPYLATAVIIRFLIGNVFTFLSSYGTAISVGITVLVAYILYRMRIAKAS